MVINATNDNYSISTATGSPPTVTIGELSTEVPLTTTAVPDDDIIREPEDEYK